MLKNMKTGRTAIMRMGMAEMIQPAMRAALEGRGREAGDSWVIDGILFFEEGTG
jgi:hypothetical protein